MPLGINDRLDCAKHSAPPCGELVIRDFSGPLAYRSRCPRSRQRLLIMGVHLIMVILHPGLQDFLVVFSAAPLAAVSWTPLIMYEAPQHTLWYAIVENGNEERRSPQACASLLS